MVCAACCRNEALMLNRSILLARNFVAEATTLCCEVRAFAQVLNPAEQELELPIRSCGCILRNLSKKVSILHILLNATVIQTHHVSREFDSDECKTTLSVPLAKVTSTTKRAQV